jgi:hypothetical protein
MRSLVRQLVLLLTIFIFAGFALPARSLTPAEYRQKARKLGAVTIYSAAQLQQVRQIKLNAAVEVWGNVSGVSQCADNTAIILRLPDGGSVELTTKSLPREIQTGVKIKALTRGNDSPGISSLTVEMLTLDDGKRLNPSPLRPESSLTLTPGPGASTPKPTQISPLPSRGGEDRLITSKRAITYFNSRLTPQEVDTIANSIVNYSANAGIDPYLVIALVAAESRFNPNACSYKGAMGLGQLMPGTANGMGVGDPFDPVQNLAGAIRLLQGHLAKYQNQPYQVALALAAYNAGGGAVRKYGGIPPYRETQNYIWKVYEYYCWMYGVQPESRAK